MNLGSRYKLIGAILLCLSVILYAHKTYFIANALSAQGVIQTLRTQGKGQSFTVSYQVGESNYLVKTDVTRSPTRYRVGDEVSVLYDPGMPSQAIIDDFLEKWFWSLSAGILGVVVLGVGLVRSKFSTN